MAHARSQEKERADTEQAKRERKFEVRAEQVEVGQTELCMREEDGQMEVLGTAFSDDLLVTKGHERLKQPKKQKSCDALA